MRVSGQDYIGFAGGWVRMEQICGRGAGSPAYVGGGATGTTRQQGEVFLGRWELLLTSALKLPGEVKFELTRPP